MNLLEENINWSMEHECLANKTGDEGCLALLEVGVEDIYLSYRIRSYRDACGEIKKTIKFYYTFKCPCCFEETFIEEERLPLSIKKIVLMVEKEKGRRKIALSKNYVNC